LLRGKDSKHRSLLSQTNKNLSKLSRKILFRVKKYSLSLNGIANQEVFLRDLLFLRVFPGCFVFLNGISEEKSSAAIFLR
jgi:hypothetical protein